MKTEVCLANALQELMSKEALDDISVKRLSDICQIKRQTFYYHFRDIYDLLTWIFLNEKIETSKPAKTYEEAIHNVLKYIMTHKKFIQNTLSSAGRDLFIQFISSYLYGFTIKEFQVLDQNNLINTEERRFYTSYFVSGTVSAIVAWIDKGMKESEEVLLGRLHRVLGGYVGDLIKHYNV